MNKLYILALILIISIIFSIFYNPPIKESATSENVATIATILGDNSLNSDQKINMIKHMSIGDSNFLNVLNNSASNDTKVQQLRPIFNVW